MIVIIQLSGGGQQGGPCPDLCFFFSWVLFSVKVITQLTKGGQQGGPARVAGASRGGGTGGGGQHEPRGGHGQGRTGRGKARRMHYAPGSH